MKKIVRIHQKDLHKMIQNQLKEQGFLGETPDIKDGAYKAMEHLPQEQVTPKIGISLSEKEIIFLEDILSSVNPDDQNEKEMLESINHTLKTVLQK